LRGAELSGGQRREVNAKGRAVTQRVEPSLALVEADMPPEAFAAEEDWQPAPGSHMGILRSLFSFLFRGRFYVHSNHFILQLSERQEWTL